MQPLGWDEDELPNGRLRLLLQRAEQRLGTLKSAHKYFGKNPAWQRESTLRLGILDQPYVSTIDGIARAETSWLVSGQRRRLSDGARTIDDPVIGKQSVVKEKGVTAGPNFYDLPRTNITSDLKADMRLLQMRSMLDPRRHYKKRPEATIPKYSQMGTIIQGRTEYFSSRLPKGKHRRTFLEEVLTNETSTGHLRKRYNEIQASKTSGRKAFYKRLKDKRSSRTCKR